MNFVIKIDEAIPIMCQLLWSKTPTDVLEAIDFFVNGFEAGVTGCLVGVRRMLSLIRSKEQTVKSAVVDAYKRIYLSARGANPRYASIYTNICRTIYFQKSVLIRFQMSWLLDP